MTFLLSIDFLKIVTMARILIMEGRMNKSFPNRSKQIAETPIPIKTGK
jgi:hypothetical protein